MNDLLFEYKGDLYPDYLRRGNAMQFIAPIALQFCRGQGLDIGCSKWPLLGAVPIELNDGSDAMALPWGPWDFVFSSHCLEHLVNPVAALSHWKDSLRPGGVLFLHLPHPDQKYWRPQACAKHLHSWTPAAMAEIVRDLGFVNVLHGERDLYWSFSVVAFKDQPHDTPA